MRKYWILFIVLFVAATTQVDAQKKDFVIVAPKTVVKGAQFQLQYVLQNAEPEGKIEFNPEIKGFDVLYGPSTSQSSSTSWINGKSSSSSSVSYVYFLLAKEEGELTLPAAQIRASGANYATQTATIKVLPPDKNAEAVEPGRQPQATTSKSTGGNFDPKDAFVRAIFSKTKVNEQEAVVVTFRFYTVLNITNVSKIEFPEFEGFMTEDFEIPTNVQFEMEHYQGRNYYAVDVKRSLLFPQRAGKITIPSGKMEITFEVSSGKTVRHPLFGVQEIMTDTKRTLKTSPVTIDIAALPAGKPASFLGGVGTFAIKSKISNTKVKANEAVTLTVDITGTGNMKLLKDPVVELDKSFEAYDPKVNNNFSTTTQGLKGTKSIEYLFIPRYAGNYTIPAIEFSYYDPATRSYKTTKTEAYKLEVAVDPNAKNASGGTSYMNQKEVKVEQDIRYIKTDTYNFANPLNFTVAKSGYILWYMIPLLVFFAVAFVYRKQIKANADISGMRTKRANRMATRRLRLANKHMQINNKEGFYDEVLRAVWGYLSDKLTIPAANLNRENIGQELLAYGAGEELIKEYIEILDTCEFARYAPVESEHAMDKLYNETVDAIGKMENAIKL